MVHVIINDATVIPGLPGVSIRIGDNAAPAGRSMAP